MQNKLGKILLPIMLLILTSCSGADRAASSSLNADDIWDQMAAERQKPVPVDAQTDDSDEILTEMPFVTSSDPLSAEDIDTYGKTLRTADKTFQAIVTDLAESFAAMAQEGLTPEDRQAHRRTVQLYLSRLIILQNNVDRAMNAVGTENPALRDKIRDLMGVLAAYIVRTRSRLDEFTSLTE